MTKRKSIKDTELEIGKRYYFDQYTSASGVYGGIYGDDTESPGDMLFTDNKEVVGNGYEFDPGDDLAGFPAPSGDNFYLDSEDELPA